MPENGHCHVFVKFPIFLEQTIPDLKPIRFQVHGYLVYYMRQSSLLEFDIPENKFIIINYIYYINAKSLIKVTIHVFLLSINVIFLQGRDCDYVNRTYPWLSREITTIVYIRGYPERLRQ
jgi:hypothetical protein